MRKKLNLVGLRCQLTNPLSIQENKQEKTRYLFERVKGQKRVMKEEAIRKKIKIQMDYGTRLSNTITHSRKKKQGMRVCVWKRAMRNKYKNPDGVWNRTPRTQYNNQENKEANKKTQVMCEGVMREKGEGGVCQWLNIGDTDSFIYYPLSLLAASEKEAPGLSFVLM